MNLLLINYEYPPVGGGAATATWQMSRELVKQEHKVIILTANYKALKGWREEVGIQVYRCWAWRKAADRSSLLEQLSFLVSGFFAIPRLLKQTKIDGIIVYFSIPCGPLGVWAKIIKGIPYVISLRGGDVPGMESSVTWLHALLKPLRRVVLKQSQAIVANSPGLKQLAEHADPFDIKVIFNGVDTDFFYPLEQLDKQPFRFLYVGRFFHPQKNLFFLLEQLKQTKISLKTPFICDMVGDGPWKKKLQHYATQLNLNDHIIWHGWLPKPQLRERYQQANCFLNPSLSEGMPNAVLEAMACGLPIIASDVMGNQSVVQAGKTGFLIDLEKPVDFQNALQWVLTHPQQAQQLGRAGREWVVDAFSWSKVAQEYVRLFDQ